MLLDALGIGIYMPSTFIVFVLLFQEGTPNYLIVSVYLLVSYYVIVLAFGAKAIFSPQAASPRLFPLEDRDAKFLYQWILRTIFIAAFFAGTSSIFRRFGVNKQQYLMMYSSSGSVVILALVIMIWQSRQRLAQAIWTEDSDAGSGSMGTVTNNSRDYIISKLDFRVRYDTDVNKVRKIIKKINKKIMKDEEMGPVMLTKLKF
jgi:hypothetical protein